MFRQEFTNLAIFQGLSDKQLQALDVLVEECDFPQDALIFDQGQSARYMYILLEGEVSIRYKPYDGPPLVVARILPGGVFGWSAALQHEVYTSAALAVLESKAYRVSGVQLKQLCEKYPDTGVVLLERLASVIAERLRNTHTQIMSILSRGMEFPDDDPNKVSENER